MAPVPVIDVSALVSHGAGVHSVAEQIGLACRHAGFFYISGHGIDVTLQERLEIVSRQFFEKDLASKLNIRMARAGRAWRGYFPVGDELTSGQPDLKEGLYFGTELPDDDPRVVRRVPLHGKNLFPEDIPGFRETILRYMEAMTELGHALMRGISLSMGLPPDYFTDRYMSDPITLFRIFHYPPVDSASSGADSWGVGEHTDYGVLTILKQDDVGGLQVKSKGSWITAEPIPNTFVCNIGDMLDKMTGGYYQSTPHRVRNRNRMGRLSYPFFFDPDWNARIEPVVIDHRQRKSVGTRIDPQHEKGLFGGTYGEYLLDKVSHVFPELKDDVGLHE